MIIITEKTKNLKTGETTKSVTKTKYMSDWVNKLNEWCEKNLADSNGTITTETWKRKCKIGFSAKVRGIKYKLIIEWI